MEIANGTEAVNKSFYTVEGDNLSSDTTKEPSEETHPVDDTFFELEKKVYSIDEGVKRMEEAVRKASKGETVHIRAFSEEDLKLKAERMAYLVREEGYEVEVILVNPDMEEDTANAIIRKAWEDCTKGGGKK